MDHPGNLVSGSAIFLVICCCFSSAEKVQVASDGAVNLGQQLAVFHEFELFHRQHPSSPYQQQHNNITTTSRREWLATTLSRDALRLKMLKERINKKLLRPELNFSRDTFELPSRLAKDSNTNSKLQPISGVSGEVTAEGIGEYFVSIKVGSAAQNALMTIDTGSGLTWLQCTPCMICYSQELPFFIPGNSSTYAQIPCSSDRCVDTDSASMACSSTNSCVYGVGYGDGSFSEGYLATETLIFTSTVDDASLVAIPDVVLGCGVLNFGSFTAESGLIGLNRDLYSFAMQTASTYSQVFTYCLADIIARPNATSRLSFGIRDESNSNMEYTPMMGTELYYLNLTGITIGSSALPITPTAFELQSDNSGGLILDSGTTLTYLVDPPYTMFRDAFIASTGLNINGFSLMNDSATSIGLDTCYETASAGDDAPPPGLTSVMFHLADGVHLELGDGNIFIEVDDGIWCLTFASGGENDEGGLSIIGNIQQQNFQIQYDLANSRIGFAPANCGGD
ncbi:hypothetical protein BDL97_03G135700 [Sphagnum fallax]|nr:hypothetical protein BDL97_03G135700 [Sphagnum fallax]